MDGRFMELALTPSGRITVRQITDSDDSPPADLQGAEPDGQLGRVAKSFGISQGDGLFLLATERLAGPLPPTFSYWREFAVGYLTALCHTPEIAGLELEAIVPPTPAELATLILSVPPMHGAEYLNETVLVAIWDDLDTWVRDTIAAGGEGLSGFLKRRAPLWHQVGRVCFHLAENRRSEDCPFAFLATYAPGVASGSRVQYQPLSRALRELAGARNKQALVRLLSPVHLASQQSALVKELVDSGDLYQPLAWTPHEAYRFLKDVPVLEESGILVRMPDWWKKRPRPRVGVTIGDAKQKKFDARGMLDFQVQLALGDQQLTEAEWHALMSADDGLVMLRGQWVEVDRQKLQEALALEAGRAAAARGAVVPGRNATAGWFSRRPDRGRGRRGRPAMVVRACWPMAWRNPGQDAESRDTAAAGSQQRSSESDIASVPGDGCQLAAVSVESGPGGLLGGRHGTRARRSRSWHCCWLARTSGRPAVPVDASGVALGQLEGRDGPFRADAARHIPASGRNAQGGARPHRGGPGRALRNTDVVVTSYGMLLRHEWLSRLRWQLAVLDEAQAIKNPAARQTKAVKRIQADARIVMTGTPVENRLSDLWSLFDFLCPGLLGTQPKFKEFAKKLGDREENRYAPLRSLVQPYILRRLKTDRRIIDDLPEKVEVQAFCGLSKRQAALYAKLVQELTDLLESVDGMKRRGLVLAYLMRFKQLCNHPSQLLGDGRYVSEESGKFARLAEICEEIASRQEKVLIFTQFREMTEPLAAFLSHVFGAHRTGAARRHDGQDAARPLSINSSATTGRRSSSCRSRPAGPA